jgi:hypothetical protein
MIARAGVHDVSVSPAELDSYHQAWVEGASNGA